MYKVFKWTILGYFLIIASSIQAEKSFRFEFTDKAFQAYEYSISLQFDKAKLILNDIKSEDPENLIVHHIENYIDFFTIFINENEADFEKLKKNKERRLKEIRKGDRKSPYYLYSQAEIHLQWALARLKFEEYFTAFNEVSKAYRLLEENQFRHPSFVANKKSLGLLHAIIGTIPDKYKWGVKLIGGLDGTIDQGCKEIEEVLAYAQNNTFIFEEETRVVYALLLLNLKNEREDAWEYIQETKLEPKNNPLASFIFANMAMKIGKNDEAIDILSNRPKGEEFYPFHYLDYMLAKAKLNRLDDDADLFFHAFISKYKGKNYIKEAYQKLAWIAVLNDDSNAYDEYMEMIKYKGGHLIDEDKQAQKEAERGIMPNAKLLKGRLLFDGGYYEEALKAMEGMDASTLSTKDQIEYRYRLGRIYHKSEQHEEALAAYQASIDKGESLPYYFACNAALQSGLIHEELKNYPSAKTYFKLCRSMKPEEYKTSLHQKAKSGLQRLP
jgi:predicted Zn-dependent protease